MMMIEFLTIVHMTFLLLSLFTAVPVCLLDGLPCVSRLSFCLFVLSVSVTNKHIKDYSIWIMSVI